LRKTVTIASEKSAWTAGVAIPKAQNDFLEMISSRECLQRVS